MKNNIKTILLLIIFTVLLIVTGYFAQQIHHGIVIFIFVFLLGTGLLTKMHSIEVMYLCKSCGREFKISLLQDLLSLHNVNKKYLKCPHCHQRNWHKEV